MAGWLVLASLLAALVGAATGALLSALWTRRRMSELPRTFRCKIAPNEQWPRSMSHALWAHDVLVVSSGSLHTSVRPIGVHFAEGPIEPSAAPTGLGRHPLVLSLHLDDGRQVRLAAPQRDTFVAAGPFLAAVAMQRDVRHAGSSDGDDPVRNG